MRRTWFVPILFLMLLSLACSKSVEPIQPFPNPTYTPEASVFGSGRTAYGFFPVPAEVTLESVFATYWAMGQHADVVWFQEDVPWTDFVQGVDGESKLINDFREAANLAGAHNLEAIYLVDPLNGLDRRQFFGLPTGWQASFTNPDVRRAYLNYSLRLVREFRPRYLGLASEINTYAEANPDDFQHFLSLYRETYAAIKAEAPETQVFVTFQWEQLNGLVGGVGSPYEIKWEQVEIFEPQLDLWVISSYPFIAFQSGHDIPADYYTPLLTRTSKPLAVAEGGYISRQTQGVSGKPQDQVDYLNAVHDQLGPRLDFWIYLLLNDMNQASWNKHMRQEGLSDTDVNTLGHFVSVGLCEQGGQPKPALAVWDSFRGSTP
jgi:hypothetical protein